VILEPGATVAAAALTEVEIAYGLPIGVDPESSPLAVAPTPLTPRQALEDVLLEALRRPPCAISFSGGRDSSALLSIATTLARREGLPEPIPVTLRFPGSSETDEDEWQLLVLASLGLADWVRIDVVADEFDVVGPQARQVLSAHGLTWPFNLHFHAPIVDTVPGGSLVTGFGGDEIGMSSATSRAEQVLARRRRPALADVLTVGLALSPYPLRRAVHRHRVGGPASRLPWLSTTGLRAVRAEASAAAAQLPLGWNKVLRHGIHGGRYFAVCQANFAAMGAAADVQVFHPFVAPAVLDALAKAGGFGGLGSRTEVMRLLCGDDLPERVISRATKGSFTSPMLTATARAFAESWSGEGVSADLVDPDALRSHWLSENVNLLSTTLMQAAWLHDNSRGRP
jgi:hypothetical protein